MDLTDLPMELFLLVTQRLNDVDKQCLRLTCSAYRQIIPFVKPPAIPRYLDHENRPPPFDFESHQRLYYLFLERLVKSGNVFSSKNALLCGCCIRLKDAHKAYPMKGLRIDDMNICGDCVLLIIRGTMPAGHKQSYNGKTYYICEDCGFSGEGDEIHRHLSPYPYQNEVQMLCEDCHWGVCSLPGCHGWPLSLRRQNGLRDFFFPYFFNGEGEEDNDDRCRWCGAYHDKSLLHPDDYMAESEDVSEKLETKDKETIKPDAEVSESNGEKQGVAEGVQNAGCEQQTTKESAVSNQVSNDDASAEKKDEQNDEDDDSDDDDDSEYDWEGYCREITSMELARAASLPHQKRIDSFFTSI